MRILITGAAGFIGSHLALELSRDPENEILAVDSFSDYYAIDFKIKRIHHLLSDSPNEVQRFDLIDFNQTQSVLRDFKPQVIYHLAAQAGVRISPNNYQRYFEDNLLAFSNVITAAVSNDVEDFIYASSSSVYGNRDTGSFRESDQDLRPTSVYGSTKLSNEIMARAFSDRHGIRTRGLRFFTVYGPWGRPDMAYFRIISAILNKSEFELFGDGNVFRDFTFIQDAVNMTVKLGRDLTKRQAKFADVVNLGGGKPRALLEMISYLERCLEVKLPIVRMERNLSDVKITHANSGYLESLVGKVDFISMESGLDEVLNWTGSEVTKEELLRWSNSVL